MLICDEAHRLKTIASKTTLALKGFKDTQVRLALTGTALQNSFQELWCLFDWCNPDALGSKKVFKKSVTEPILTGQVFGATVSQVGKARLCAERFQLLIKPMFLRRTKAIIKDQLPTKTDMVVFAAPSQLQREVWECPRLPFPWSAERFSLRRQAFNRMSFLICRPFLHFCCSSKVM